MPNEEGGRRFLHPFLVFFFFFFFFYMSLVVMYYYINQENEHSKMSRGGNNPCQTKYKKNQKEKQNDFIWDLRFSCEIGASADEIVYTVTLLYVYLFVFAKVKSRWLVATESLPSRTRPKNRK